jgi:hypothetical protein
MELTEEKYGITLKLSGKRLIILSQRDKIIVDASVEVLLWA